MANFIFQETQRFRQFWIWAILILVIGFALGSTFFSTEENLDWQHSIPFGIVGLVFLLLLKLELNIKIDQDSLSFSYFPFLRERTYSFKDLDSLELIEYNGLLEYGAWGIKWNLDSWSYTTGGNHGILVKTAMKKFLLGTQKPEDAKRVIALFNEFKLQSHGS